MKALFRSFKQSEALPLNQWSHCVATLTDGTNLKMYINDKIDDIYSKIEKENDIEKIYKLLDRADGLMAK